MTLFRGHLKNDLLNQTGEFTNPYIDKTRLPLSTPIELHTHFVNWFSKKFGISFRSKGLFCTGDITEARKYTDTYHSLIKLNPIGDFDLCYSPNCKDLYEHFKNNFPISYSNEEKVFCELDRLGFIVNHNNGLLDAAESGNEVIIVAQKFSYEVIES